MISGAPTNGTSAVQTLTIGGTPTGGSFSLALSGIATAPIAWSATDATLIANIKAKVEALGAVGSGNTTVAAGTGSSGIGTYLITFAGALAVQSMPTMTVNQNSLAGTTPTVAIATTTAGVTATLKGVLNGTAVVDYTGAREWTNTGTANAPIWVRTGRLTAVVPIAGVTSTSGGGIASWTPPEGAPVIVLRVILYTTVKSTGAANASIGVAANATTSAANLIDTLAVGSATVCADNITDASTNGKARQLLASGSYVTVTGSADTTGMVGSLYIEYFKP